MLITSFGLLARARAAREIAAVDVTLIAADDGEPAELGDALSFAS